MNAKINKTPGGVLVDGKPAPGLAVHGYDVVSFFTDGKPAQGDATYSYVHGDATYRFVSQPHLDAFRANTEKYVPGFGGFCAFGVSVGAGQRQVHGGPDRHDPCPPLPTPAQAFPLPPPPQP